MQDWLPLFIVYFAVMDPLGRYPTAGEYDRDVGVVSIR